VGRSITAQLAKTGEGVTLTDRNPGKADTTHVPVLAEGQIDLAALDVFLASDDDATKFAGERAGVGRRAAARRHRPALDNARLLECLTAFQIELSAPYGLDSRLTFKLLPAELWS
jgi:hypothetical protein